MLDGGFNEFCYFIFVEPIIVRLLETVSVAIVTVMASLVLKFIVKILISVIVATSVLSGLYLLSPYIALILASSDSDMEFWGEL